MAYNVESRPHLTLPGGITQIADVEDSNNRILQGITADGIICDPTGSLPGVFCLDLSQPLTEKSFIGIGDPHALGEENGLSWVAYLGVECYLNGQDLVVSQMEAAWGAREHVGVDQGFFTQVLAPMAVATTAPVATTLEEALAQAEAQVALMGGGIIHMSTYAASLLGSAVRYSGTDFNNLYTRQGTRINARANDPATPYSLTIYVTGPVTLYRGMELSKVVPVPETNRVRALVERPWAALIDCGAYLFTVTAGV